MVSVNDFKDLLNESMQACKGVLNERDSRDRDFYSITGAITNYVFNKPCAFKEGDWVTPKEASNLRRPGEPCKVIAAYDCTQYQFVGAGSPLVEYDMLIGRVGFSDDTSVYVYVGNSDDYEPYTGLVYGDAGELNE